MFLYQYGILIVDPNLSIFWAQNGNKAQNYNALLDARCIIIADPARLPEIHRQRCLITHHSPLFQFTTGAIPEAIEGCDRSFNLLENGLQC